MVTWPELFLFVMLLIALLTLFYQIINKK